MDESERRMKFQRVINMALATAVIGTFSLPAHANNCGELSPLMTSLGKQYTELSYAPENATNTGKLGDYELIELIDNANLRSGHGVRVECLGDDGQWEEDRTTFTLTHIEHRENNKGSFMLSAFEESVRELNREVIELPSAEKWQTNADNSLSTSYLFRLHNFSTGGSRAAELALTIQNKAESIVITESLFINGLRVDWVTWELDT